MLQTGEEISHALTQKLQLILQVFVSLVWICLLLKTDSCRNFMKAGVVVG